MPTCQASSRRTHGSADRALVDSRHDRLTVSVAQADPREGASLAWSLETVGYRVASSSCGEELLRTLDPRWVGCLVLDLHLPDFRGTELVRRLRRVGCRQPYLITADACDAEEAVELILSGAVDLLVKPWPEERLLASVARASLQHQRWNNVQTRLDRLSRRERQVLELVIAGLPTKQIARRLNISPRTVDVHRSNIGKKLEVSSFAELVQTITEHELTKI